MFWKNLFRMPVVGKRLFEWRPRQAIANAARKVAQVQSLARGVNWSQQPLQSPPQILRANQERLGFFFTRLNQANRRQCRQSREEVFVRTCRIEFESAIEFNHAVRILRGG